MSPRLHSFLQAARLGAAYLLTALVATVVPGAPATGSGPRAVSSAAEAAADGLLPLLRPDRVLHYRGRSSMRLSRPDDRLRPTVGQVFSTLVLAGEMDGKIVMLLTSYPYSDDVNTSAGLSAPRERRRDQILLDPELFTVALLEQTSEAYLSRGRWGRPAALTFTSDGFGLNRAARFAAGLWTLAVPVEMVRRLRSEGEVRHAYDFYLTIDDPLADRVVVTASGGPPKNAEARITGVTTLHLEGVEAYPVDRRWPAPPLTADAPVPPPMGRADERLTLPGLRVRVQADLTVERLRGPAARRLTTRRDRLTWTVLDRPDTPWLLAREGLVSTESGNPDDPDLREASFSRELVRIEEQRRP